MIHNEMQNIHVIYFVPSMKPRIKEPTNNGIPLKPRKLASTNESSFTVYYDSMVETKLKLK